MNYFDESSPSIEFDLNQSRESAATLSKSINSANQRSFNSIAASSALQSTASSSKAVLAALRALQDKIRRLEIEKAQALDDAAQLRSQLKSQEIEANHLKERDVLQSQRTLQEARLLYEKVLSEKTEMETKLRTLDRQNEELTQELTELTNQNRLLEEQKTSASNRLSELQAQVQHIELELQQSQQKEKGYYFS
jgi:chromosome segregation ATPase